MKKSGVFLSLMLVVQFAQAQKYITAAGLRVSKKQIGLTVQQRIMPKSTLELIGAVGSSEYSGTALIEKHYPIISRGLNYYLGAGGHVGHLKDVGTFYGGDVILGAEMKLPFLPVTISADLKPAFHVNHADWFTFGGGFSIRSILIKEKKKKSIFNWDSKTKNDDGGIFGNKKKEKTKSKFDWFGTEEKEEEKQKSKFNWFGSDEEKEKDKEKKEESKPEKKENRFKLFEK